MRAYWLGFNCMVGKNYDYAFELDCFRLLRNFNEGIDFFNLDFHWYKYEADHQPSVGLMLEILNFKIIEMEVYNINHHDGTNHE